MVRLDTPDDPLPEELEPLLPPDAPEGHQAHLAVKYGGNPSSQTGQLRAQFRFEKIAFQTTVSACGGSAAAALRLARACYVMFADEGKSKEEVAQFRGSVYEQIKLAAGVGGNKSVVPNEKATRKAARDEGGDQAQMQERQESEAAKTAATDRQPEEKVGQPPAKPVQENEVKADKPATSASDQQPSFAEREAAVLKLLGEVPDDAMALRLYPMPSKGAWYYKFDADGKKNQQLQTTEKQAGSSAVAQRILHLCAAKLQAGETKEQALEFRGELYRKVAESGIVLWGGAEGNGSTAGAKDEAKESKRAKADAKRAKAEAKEVGAGKEAKRAKAEDGAEPKKKKRKTAAKASSAQPTAAQAAAAAAKDSDSDSSSSSSSSSSEESAAEGDGKASSEGAAPPGVEAAKRAGPPRLVAAKMLAKTGLRCPCHFLHAWECQRVTGFM